jgi:hypothetical protein
MIVPYVLGDYRSVMLQPRYGSGRDEASCFQPPDADRH